MPDDVSIECESGIIHINFPFHADFNSYDFFETMKRSGVNLTDIEWEWCG